MKLIDTVALHDVKPDPFDASISSCIRGSSIPHVKFDDNLSLSDSHIKYVRNDVEETLKMYSKNNIEVRIADKVYEPISVNWTQSFGVYPTVSLDVNLSPYRASAAFRKPATKPFPSIKKVHFNDPVTVVLWEDGTKTIVRAQNGEAFDPEKGLTMAITKKVLGNKGSYFDEIKKWTEPYMKERDELQSLTRAVVMSGILTHYDADLEPPYEEDR